jgi:hypothetical protein
LKKNKKVKKSSKNKSNANIYSFQETATKRSLQTIIDKNNSKSNNFNSSMFTIKDFNINNKINYKESLSEII